MGGESRGVDRCICTTDSLLYTWNEHSIVNQVYSEKLFKHWFCYLGGFKYEPKKPCCDCELDDLGTKRTSLGHRH